MVILGSRGEVQIQNLTRLFYPRMWGMKGNPFWKLWFLVLPETGKFSRCWIASTKHCPELSVYFYSVQNYRLLFYVFLSPVFALLRVESQEWHFRAWERCSAVGIPSKEVTCVPFSSHQSVVYCHGGRIGFFQGDIRLLSDDMKALRPTIFPVVPRLLNRMYDKVSLTLFFL